MKKIKTLCEFMTWHEAQTYMENHPGFRLPKVDESDGIIYVGDRGYWTSDMRNDRHIVVDINGKTSEAHPLFKMSVVLIREPEEKQ